MKYLIKTQLAKMSVIELQRYKKQLQKQKKFILEEANLWVIVNNNVTSIIQQKLLELETMLAEAEEDRLNSDYSLTDALRYLH